MLHLGDCELYGAAEHSNGIRSRFKLHSCHSHLWQNSSIYMYSRAFLVGDLTKSFKTMATAAVVPKEAARAQKILQLAGSHD